jgi:hypothetical protein
MSESQLSTTEISKKLGITVTTKLITTLGIEPSSRYRQAVYYTREDVVLLANKLVEHFQGIAVREQAALDDEL